MADRIWTPKSKDDLKKLINANIALSSIDTSLISDMSEVFKNSGRTDFSGIERWNTSNVTNMECMFSNAIHFNANISAWDTSKVVNMGGMFGGAWLFNQPLDSWNVSNVENMAFMFACAESFNKPLNSWDTSSVRDMACMFFGALSFNQPLDKWITVFVENMGGMFSYAKSSNQNINDWNVSNVINMGRYNGIFSGKICNTGELNDKYKHYESINSAYGLEFGIDDSGMFGEAVSFNQPLDKWNVSSVMSMERMFEGAKSFSQNLDSWSVDSLCPDDVEAYEFRGSAMENNLPKWCKK